MGRHKIKNKVKKTAAQYHNSIVNLAGFLTVTLIFISGIGRYRVVLVYAVYSLLRAVLPLIKGEPKILFLVPATIIALFFDITGGPLYPIFTKNYLLIALPVMIVLDTLVRNSIGKLIANITEDRLFVICPTCKFDNKDLVEKCSYCSYKKGDKLIVSVVTKQNVNNKIPSKALDMLRLPDGEDILFHKKIFRNMAILKNGKRQVRKYFFITTNTLIFLDYFLTAKGWREKDTIPLSKIVSIEGKMKRIYISEKPFFIIKASSTDIYEIVFSSFGKYRQEIAEIANFIRKINPQVETKINLPEPDNSWEEIWKSKI